MPLPLGHAAIGFAAHSLCRTNGSPSGRWKTLLGILIVSNLPDLDVALGIVFRGNGNAFHRGPTHSLIFALIGGFLTYRVWAYSSQLPKLSFRICFLLLLSHVAADFVFTGSPISFVWPIAVNWSDGYTGLRHVISMVLFGNYQDAKIIIGCTILILLHRTFMGFGMLKSDRKLKNIFQIRN